MRTTLTQDPNEAAVFIRNGGIVAFPTETVYGLGADVFDGSAIEKIFAAKDRPADNPLIAHISDLDHLDDLCAEITPSAARFIEALFPGPLTVVLRKTARVPFIATAGLNTIGVRMPRFALAREFIDACGTPVVAPSANLSGRPSPTTWQAVVEDLDGRIDCILQGEPTEIGLESTVVDCTTSVPVVLRSGSVSLNELRAVVPSTEPHDADDEEAPRSPGLRHRHYSPRARVIIAANDEESAPGAAWIGLKTHPGGSGYSKVCRDVEHYAHDLFEFFRECDRRGIKTIYCERVDDGGIGKALMDRIERAAAG